MLSVTSSCSQLGLCFTVRQRLLDLVYLGNVERVRLTLSSAVGQQGGGGATAGTQRKRRGGRHRRRQRERKEEQECKGERRNSERRSDDWKMETAAREEERRRPREDRWHAEGWSDRAGTWERRKEDNQEQVRHDENSSV